MNLDENALNDHFLIGMGFMSDAFTDVANPPFTLLAENQPAANIDQTSIYGFWSIEPGASTRVQSDGMMLQLGMAYLKLVAPLGSLEQADAARDLRDQCLALFRNWRSADKCLEVYQLSTSTPPSKDSYQIKVSLFWRSLRV